VPACDHVVHLFIVAQILAASQGFMSTPRDTKIKVLDPASAFAAVNLSDVCGDSAYFREPFSLDVACLHALRKSVVFVSYTKKLLKYAGLSLIDWISDLLSQGYTDLESLAKCLDHRGIVSHTVCSQATVCSAAQCIEMHLRGYIYSDGE